MPCREATPLEQYREEQRPRLSPKTLAFLNRRLNKGKQKPRN